MANYMSTTRTNYFRVKDPEAFRTFMATVEGTEGSVELWEEKDNNGNLVFGFGTYGSLSGICDVGEAGTDVTSEPDYEEFINGLQDHVAEDDAVIILEAGNEKLRYVVGSATIVTSRDCEYLNITDLAVSRVSALLGNPDWKTKCEY